MYHKEESLLLWHRRWPRRPCKCPCCGAGGRGCSSQNGKLLSEAFYQDPVPVTAPGLAECDEELRASRLFQIPFFLWRQEKKKVIFKLSGLYQLSKSKRAGGSAAWKTQGVCCCQGGVTGVPTPCPGVASWPVRANGHRCCCSFVGQAGIHGGWAPARQAAESRLQRGNECSRSGDRRPGPPQSIPARPAGLQVGPSGCLRIVEGALLPAIKTSFIPIIFRF